MAWAATCGTITQTGKYTAPAQPGTCLVIARAGASADTARVTVATPPPIAGVPFGASQVWNDLLTPRAAGFTLAQDPVTPDKIVLRLQLAKQYGWKVVLNLPGGSHDKYMSVIRDTLRFDHGKWSAALQEYDTPEITAAVAKAVSEGTLIGANYMDEPHTCGKGDGNTWGPCGELTKVRVDSLCAEGKALFPSLPAGITHQHQLFDVSGHYRVCEFLIDQYKYALGSLTAFRDGALQMAQRDGMVILFGANWLDGGVQDRDTVWDCKDQGGYLGERAPLCQMTPPQVDETARALGPYGCGFRGWRWDWTDLADYQPTFTNLGAWLATQPGRSCDARN